ncbi:MAG: hypothetical protein WC749_07960 [Dehalococcoidia bacterium]
MMVSQPPIDFEFWAKEYAKMYLPIKYRDEEGKPTLERSPYFESISKVIQKRGHLLKEEFQSIYTWKTKRRTSTFRTDDKEEIRKITAKVISEHPDPARQIWELTQLPGVGLRVASAILTVIFPKDYCILDYRTWKSLLWIAAYSFTYGENYLEFSKTIDRSLNYASLDCYLHYYLEEIRGLADKYSLTPRMIEMALWAYDKKEGSTPRALHL